MGRKLPIEEIFTRFIRRASIPDDPNACWVWNGNKTNRQYPLIKINGKPKLATRWIYTLVHGYLQEGVLIRHKCDNPPCVNPMHLETGNHKDNNGDMLKRGRARPPKGEQHYRARLTADDIIKIRSLSACGVSAKYIAPKFHISGSQVFKIATRLQWKHVP